MSTAITLHDLIRTTRDRDDDRPAKRKPNANLAVVIVGIVLGCRAARYIVTLVPPLFILTITRK